MGFLLSDDDYDVLFIVTVLDKMFGITSFTLVNIINSLLFSKVKLSDFLFYVQCLLVIKRQLFLGLHVASLMRNWCPA